MHLLYYYIYRFYKTRASINDPHLYTVLAIATLIALPVATLSDWISIIYFCRGISTFLWMLFFISSAGIFYTYFRGSEKKLIKKAPLLFGSEKIAIAVTVIFVLSGLFFLFQGAIIGGSLLSKCR